MMNKEKFWELIDQARNASNGDTNGMYSWLKNWLVMNSDPEDVLVFDDIMREYHRLSYKYGLWTAAMVMSNGWRSDDGFHYFQGWLIAQGKDVYMNALANPDSLADIDVIGRSEFEGIDYIAGEAYEDLTGEDFYRTLNHRDEVARTHQSLVADIKYGDGIEDWHTEDVHEYLPNLCQAYDVE